VIRVQCPRCQTRFTTSNANVGKTGQCPKCGNPIKVTASGAAPAHPTGGGGGGSNATAAAPASPAGASAGAATDSALGEARRHAAQATPAGQAQPAARPAPQREAPRPPPPPAEAKPVPAEAPADKTAALPEGKSKTVALLLCVFLGAIGTHRFYMGSWGWGLVIMGLNLTCIGGAIFALVDIIKLAAMDKADFQDRYSETVVQPFTF